MILLHLFDRFFEKNECLLILERMIEQKIVEKTAICFIVKQIFSF